jgi:probable HAF family extracellular repeat protein
VFTPVEDPAGAEGTDVTGISNLGVVVGFYIDSSGNSHGFELSPAR